MARRRNGTLPAVLAALAATAASAALPGLPAGRLVRILADSGSPSPTRVRPLEENADAMYARWYALRAATETIDLQVFTLAPDVLGKAILGLLLQKAREGVRIRLMLDRRGSGALALRLRDQKYLRELARFPNVEVEIFRAWHKIVLELPRGLRNWISSNHDKLVVVDGRLAVVGGRNLAAEYFRDETPIGGGYRDRDLLLEGTAVASRLTRAFEVEFGSEENYRIGASTRDPDNAVVRELDLAREVFDRWVSDGRTVPPEGPGARATLRLSRELDALSPYIDFRGFARDPWDDWGVAPTWVVDKVAHPRPKDEIAPELLRLIDAATSRIDIQNAYVAMTEEGLAALRRAGERGVRVRLQTNSPRSTDSQFAQALFLRDWKRMLVEIPGLELFVARDARVVHAKTLLFDDSLAWVGSYNLDPISAYTNGEVAVVVRSQRLVASIRERIDADMAASLRCEIRVEPDGTVVPVAGPDDLLEGFSGWWTRFLRALWFLRSLL